MTDLGCENSLSALAGCSDARIKKLICISGFKEEKMLRDKLIDTAVRLGVDDHLRSIRAALHPSYKYQRNDNRHIAYEPLPHMHRYLLDHFPSVDVRLAALSNEEGETSFSYVKNMPGRSGFRERSYAKQQKVEKLRVRTETLDSSLPASYIPALIKIDVEGAEQLVFEGPSEPSQSISPSFYLSMVKEAPIITALNHVRSTSCSMMRWGCAFLTRMATGHILWLNLRRHMLAMIVGTLSHALSMEICNCSAGGVWITHIMTLFTLIVSPASKPLRGRLNHHATTVGNQVMMTVIHTGGAGGRSPLAGARGVLAHSLLPKRAAGPPEAV